jgi:hypothetical protein
MIFPWEKDVNLFYSELSDMTFSNEKAPKGIKVCLTSPNASSRIFFALLMGL